VPAGQQGWQGSEGRCVDEDDELVADCGTTEALPPGQDVSQCMVTCSADDECQAVHASFRASASDPNVWSVVCRYVSSSCEDGEATGLVVGGRSNDTVPANTDCSVCFVNQHFEPTTPTRAPSCPTAVPAGQQGWQGSEGRCVDEDDELVADCGTTEALPPGQDVSQCMVTCREDDECQAVHASFRASASDPNVWNVVCRYVSSSCEDGEPTGPVVGGRSDDTVPANTDCSVCFVNQHFEPTTTTVARGCPTAVPAGQQGWQGSEGRCVDEDDELVADCGTTEALPPGQDVSHCMVTCSADDECQAVHASFKASASDPNLWSVVCKYVSSSCEEAEATGPAVGGRKNDEVPSYTDCSVCFVKPTSYQH